MLSFSIFRRADIQRGQQASSQTNAGSPSGRRAGGRDSSAGFPHRGRSSRNLWMVLVLIRESYCGLGTDRSPLGFKDWLLGATTTFQESK